MKKKPKKTIKKVEPNELTDFERKILLLETLSTIITLASLIIDVVLRIKGL